MIILRRRGDRGASLVFALIIVTTIALVMTAVMSLAFTGSRSTLAMRDRALLTYGADAGAQIAINALRTDTFDGSPGQCVTAAAAMTLPGFYPGANGPERASGYVSCTPGPGNATGNGATSANASPGSAVLTLGTAAGEDGIYVSSNAGPIKIRGGVFSNSTINAQSGGIQNTFNNPPGLPYNLARGACVNQQLLTPAQYTTCNYTTPDQRGQDPATLTPHGLSYDPPPSPTQEGTIVPCTPDAQFQTVFPGRFTKAADLNAMTGCKTGVVWFKPGRYYFDFQDPGSHVWNVNKTYVIAGTPTIPLTATPTPAQMPGSCIPPADPSATKDTTGALFVFGGDSQLALSHQGSPGGQIAICAYRSENGPPIAVYGLKTPLNGVFPVRAQSGCITAIAPATPRCSLIYTDQSPNTILTIQGTTYTPRAQLTVNLNNSTNQVFRWGLIARTLWLGTTGSADLGLPLIDVPDVAASPLPGPNVMYLSVYVCPAASTCGPSGRLRLRVKVQVDAVPPRTVTVLSWSPVP